MPHEHDCFFTGGGEWFRYRAAAIIVEDGYVLFIGNGSEDYLYSVGGAVHVNESAENAVVREVFEETGAKYEVERLAVIHENFFTGNGAHDKGLICHEIALYFLMKPRGLRDLTSHSVTGYGDKEKLYWLPIDEIGKHKCYPSFMRDYLKTMPKEILHIVTRE